MGFVLPLPARAVPSAPTIRVMSYNVNSEIGGIDPLVQEIDRFSPDVLILVEHAWDAMIPPLRERFPTVRVEGQFVGRRVSPESSFDPEEVPFSGRLRSPRWLRHTIDTPAGRIVFYQVHPIRRGRGSTRCAETACGTSS